MNHGRRSKERELLNLPIRFETAPYSTFVVPNSPLYYAAGQGHHELYLLVESGVDIINLWNYRGKDIAFRVYNKCPQLLEPVEDVLHEVINRASDGGITPLHVGAFVAHVTVEDGTTIDLIDPETNAWLEQHKHFV
ncbi:hypothetical protein HID58_051446 [Brassica napus]|uniref:Uncharacterized protein n=1 Tax=Brassica napus TaxID=3708 RepID=A0ABQ8A8Z5_BRANA|nr:hypothetical protein HID58_051446 [Brassica napus]